MLERIGFIGLGRMGQRMATRLLDADLQLTVYDVAAGKADDLVRHGARAAGSPREVAAASEAVFMSVTDGRAVLTALEGPDGLLAGAAPNLLLVEMSTIGVEDSRLIAQACEGAAVRYVRSPVLGTLDAAAGGTLQALLSGPRDAVDDALPLLEHLTAERRYLGPAEEGRIMKLLNNGMLGVTMAVFAEVLTVGQRAGLDADVILDVISGGSMGGRATQGAAQIVREGTFEPRLSAALMHKDLRLLGELASSTMTPLPVTSATQQLFAAMVAMGWGDLDRSGVVKVIERLAGMEPSQRDA
jgi:3-hydroxyisobutyrate dehydrogenase-like beta-hydroxyacid dehydrogenase